ncbi:MAG: threonine synthase [SAR116 cluster bacterium]|nr:threonine synthase [SAR116 cluster bacterium]
MQFMSTRGKDGPVSFETALLNGLARDGGLYLPVSWPKFSLDDIRAIQSKSYAELAGLIMSRFTEGDIDQAEMTELARQTYAGFTHPDVAPLKPVSDNLHVLELFYGPTIAFKDYAMQFLSRAFDRALTRQNRTAVILGATSGDTGSAALEAFKGRASVDVFILFPDGRVSPVQQKQMTSVSADGAHAVAVSGDFDDCQDMVKACFNDAAFRDEMNLSAVNSINWARLMPQIVYYFSSALKVGAPDQPVAFSVPTGNFGNVFAGWVAAQMGLPVERFIVASNRNDILTRFFATGTMERQAVDPSLSPSMDIQVSSNFERLLFELLDRDGARVADLMQQFAQTGSFAVAEDVLRDALSMFSGFCLDDEGTKEEIKTTYEDTGMIIDPHSAVGLAAARKARKSGLVSQDTPVISLACAHPAKFPDAVRSACGVHPALPDHLSDLMDRDEVMLKADNDMAAVQALLRAERR